MKFRLVALTATALFAAALARADQYDSKESFTRTGAFDARGQISLENVNGNVDVRTWDKNEILIEVEKSAKTDEELQLIDLKIDLSESRAAIKVRLPKRPGAFFSASNIRAAVRFKLTVPATASLNKISTVNSSVTLDGLRGAANVSSVNGGVHATHLGGDAKLETVNGAIKADFSAITAGQSLSFKTVNGQIAVRLVKDAGVELHGSVVNGRIDCDFPLQVAGRVRSHNLAGKIGDGRASLNAETVNGSIRLESLRTELAPRQPSCPVFFCL